MNIADPRGALPLYQASSWGQRNVVLTLIAAAADVNQGDMNHGSAAVHVTSQDARGECREEASTMMCEVAALLLQVFNQ